MLFVFCKTWLACALAHKACRDAYSVRYLRLPRLKEELGLAHGDGRFAKLMAGYAKIDLLILGDSGLAFTAAQRRDMLELLYDRYGNRSTLVTSQMPVDKNIVCSRWRTMKHCCCGTARQRYYVKPEPYRRVGGLYRKQAGPFDVLWCTAKSTKHLIDSGRF